MKFNTEKLTLTEKARYCLAQMEADTVKGKIISFLYGINLVNGKVVPGVYREADVQLIPRVVNKMTDMVQSEEFSAQEMVNLLGLEHTNCATMVTQLVNDGIAKRQAAGKKRMLSLEWDVIVQIHEALKSGRIVPAKEIKV